MEKTENRKTRCSDGHLQSLLLPFTTITDSSVVYVLTLTEPQLASLHCSLQTRLLQLSVVFSTTYLSLRLPAFNS